RLVGEGVEDAEGRGPQPDGEPCGGGRLILDHGQRAGQEPLDLVLLPRQRLESHQQPNGDHAPSPSSGQAVPAEPLPPTEPSGRSGGTSRRPPARPGPSSRSWWGGSG